MSLEIYLDQSETRVIKKRICAFHYGAMESGNGYQSMWSDYLFSDVWVDPTTYRAMLRPACLRAEWSTTNSGINARYGLSDFGLTSGTGGWSLNPVDFAGQPVLYNQGDQSATAFQTAATIGGINRGICVVSHAFGTGTATGLAMDFGWGSKASGVALAVYLDGTVEVWKGGAIVKVASIKGDSQTQSTVSGVLKILAIPCARRELLVYSPSHGGGFTVLFEDIDEAATTPEITPDAKVFFQCYGSVSLEIARIQYPSTGWICSKTIAIAERPHGSTFDPTIPDNDVFYDYGYVGSEALTASVVARDGSTPYAISDELRCRIRYSFSGGGFGTCFAYAAIKEIDPVTAVCAVDSTAVNLAMHAHTVEIESPDSPGGMAMHLSGFNPSGISAYFDGQTNRTITATIDGRPLFKGRTEPVKTGSAPFDDAETWEMECRSMWKALEQCSFRDPMPLDGLTIADALTRICKQANISVTASTSSFQIPVSRNCATGDFTAMVEVGDTAAFWVTRLMETYAATWIYDLAPDGSLYARSPEDLGTTPFITLSSNNSGGGETGRTRTLRSWKGDGLEPEATEVRVTGWDVYSQRPIQAFKVDEAAEDPTVPVAARPDNWVGEKRAYGLEDSSIVGQDTVNAVCDMLFDRLTKARDMGEMECDLLMDETRIAVRGDNIGTEYGVHQIHAWRATIEVWEDDAVAHPFKFATASYTGEIIA